MEHNTQFLETEPVGRLMHRYAIPCVISLLLPVYFGLDGVLYSMPVSDVLTFLIAAVLILRTYRWLGQDVLSQLE